MNLNNKKGFTLVELLIVIAIIAILAVVAIPQFAGMVDRAQDSAILAEMRSISARATVMDAFGDSLAAVRCSDDAAVGAADPEIAAFCEGLEANSPAGTLTYYSSKNEFCIMVEMNIAIGDNTHWCVDSTGFNGRINPKKTTATWTGGEDGSWTPDTTVKACHKLAPDATVPYHPGYDNFSCAARTF